MYSKAKMAATPTVAASSPRDDTGDSPSGFELEGPFIGMGGCREREINI